MEFRPIVQCRIAKNIWEKMKERLEACGFLYLWDSEAGYKGEIVCALFIFKKLFDLYLAILNRVILFTAYLIHPSSHIYYFCLFFLNRVPVPKAYGYANYNCNYCLSRFFHGSRPFIRLFPFNLLYRYFSQDLELNRKHVTQGQLGRLSGKRRF